MADEQETRKSSTRSHRKNDLGVPAPKTGFMNVAGEDHPKIVAFPPLLWLIGAMVSVLVHFFVFSIRILPQPFALILGIICVVAGPSLAVCAVFCTGPAGTAAHSVHAASLLFGGC